MRQGKFKSIVQSVSLADDSDLRWVSLIPEGVINAHGTQWRFDADETDAANLRFNFDDAVASLAAWLDEFAPAIAIEHDKTGTAAGYLRKIRVLSADDAAKLGIRQTVPRMIYGGLDITSDKWRNAFDGGEIPYVSPNIRALSGTERDAEPRYPFAIGEVSFVTIPQIKSQQIPVADMRGVSLSEKSNGEIMMTREEMASYCESKGMSAGDIDEMLVKVFGPVHDELHKKMDADAAIEELEKAVGHTDTAIEDEDAAKREDEALLAELREIKAALLAERKNNALFVVRSSVSRSLSPATESALADVYLSDKSKFEAMLRDLGATKTAAAPAHAKTAVAAATRTAAPVARNSASVSLAECIADGTKFDALSDDDQWAKIAELSEREKIPHWMAASWIRYGRMPDAVREMRANGRTH